jgi:hypothetical protein
MEMGVEKINFGEEEYRTSNIHVYGQGWQDAMELI